MMVPVLQYNEAHADAKLREEKFAPLKKIFAANGYEVWSYVT